MTLIDLAAEYGISRSSIYRKLSKWQINTSDVVVNGQLTADGEAMLRDLLGQNSSASASPSPSPVLFPAENGNENETGTTKTGELDASAHVPDGRDLQIAELRARLAERDKRIAELEHCLAVNADTIARLTADDSPQLRLAQQAMATLSDAQKIQAIIIASQGDRKALPPPSEDFTEPRGFWRRMFRRG